MRRKTALWAVPVLIGSGVYAGTMARSVPAVPPTVEGTPLSFTENRGQWPGAIRFATFRPGFTVHFKACAATHEFVRSDPQGNRERLRVTARFIGANRNAAIEGENPLRHRSHFLFGSDRTQWRENVPNYRAIRYRELYPGIDLYYTGDARGLKYDLLVHPSGNPGAIRIAYDGVDELLLTPSGDLRIATRFGNLVEQAPFTYQVVAGGKSPIESRYVVHPDRSFGFEITGRYDPERTLIIDPSLDYSTLIGGLSYDQVGGIAVDGSDHAYIVGGTFSPNFPATGGPVPTTHYSAYVTKFLPDGSGLVYSTFLGGDEDDIGYGIAVDAAGTAYVTGVTGSSNFPTTPGAYDTSFNGGNPGEGDIFVVRLDPAGTLTYGTYLGGTITDISQGIAIDGAGQAYIVGYTGAVDYPTTPGAYSVVHAGSADAVMTKLALLGGGPADLIYSTFLGGSDYEEAYGIDVDAVGDVFISGSTRSPDFPGTGGPPFNGTFDAFVAKLSPQGNGLADLLYNRVIGGIDHDYGLDVVADAAGNAYVTGPTLSSDFPTTGGVVQPAHGGDYDAFVTKLDLTGATEIYSTFLGSGGEDRGHSIAVDGSGHAYITGSTNSPGYPVTANAYDPTHNGGLDVFVTALETDASSVVYSTFLGGASNDIGYAVAVSATNFWYITGTTASNSFPTTFGAFDGTYNGGFIDTFVVKAPNRAPTAHADLPIDEGEMVATHFPGPFDQNFPGVLDPQGYVVTLVDTRIPPVGTNPIPIVDNNWMAPLFHNEFAPTSALHIWNAANLGQVFGACLDDAASPNIYVAATPAYGDYSDPIYAYPLGGFGPGGYAGVYRLDGINGDISSLTFTVPNGFGGVGTSDIPNEGAALGNICFHANSGNPQLFVSNFEDGKIYRLNMSGLILSVFDPFAADGGLPGFADLGERIWAVQVYGGRLYFSVWLRDDGHLTTPWPGAAGSPPADPNNSIWSVALDPTTGDFLGAEMLEIVMPYFAPSTVHSNPVADIAFSCDGRLLAAERTMNGEFGMLKLSHGARVLEYVGVSGSWSASATEYYIGATINGNTNYPANTAGGIDYDSDDNVWSSGDTLHNGFPDLIYGWQRVPAVGNSPVTPMATSYLIDQDGITFDAGKGSVGDVELYHVCGIQPTCGLSADRTDCVGDCSHPSQDCVPVEILAAADGSFIEVTCCDCVKDVCHVDVDAATGDIVCESPCTDPTDTCRLIGQGNADGTISYHCECFAMFQPTDCEFVSQCNPLCPGTCYERCVGLCEEVDEVCLPSVITESGAGVGDFHVTECDCGEVDPNRCRPIIEPVNGDVVCIGHDCPDLTDPCVVNVTVNMDGTIDYTCCPGDEPIGACCYPDAVGGLICVETTQFDCLTNLLGTYHGDGTTCASINCDDDPTGAVAMRTRTSA